MAVRFRISVLLAMLGVCANAQRDLYPERIVPRKQVAIVIGNGAYLNVNKLKNPINDAKAVAEKLEKELN